MGEFPEFGGYDRLVGKIDETVEDKIRSTLLEKYLEGEKNIDEYEVEKTPDEVEAINFSIEKAQIIANKYNAVSKDVPIERVHVLFPGGVNKFTDGRIKTGGHSTRLATVVADREESLVDFTLTTYHELMHLHSPQIARRNQDGSVEHYHVGIALHSHDGSKQYFHYLDEAIVGRLTEKFYTDNVIHHALFNEEIRQREMNGIQTDTSRMEENKKLQDYVRSIFEINPDKFNSLEEVEEIFFKAFFSGKLLSLARLIDQTFGKGSFRVLAEETAETIIPDMSDEQL